MRIFMTATGFPSTLTIATTVLGFLFLLCSNCTDNPAKPNESTNAIEVYRGSIPGLVTDAWITIDTVETYSASPSFKRMTVSTDVNNPDDLVVVPNASSNGYYYLTLKYIFDVNMVGDEWVIESVDYPLDHLHEFSGSGTISKSDRNLLGTISVKDFTCHDDTIETQYYIAAELQGIPLSGWPHSFIPAWITEPYLFRSDSVVLNDIVSNGSNRVGVGNFIYRSVSDGVWEKSMELHLGAFSKIIWTGSQYLAIGYADYLFSSFDGVSWFNICAANSGNRFDICTDGHTYIALRYHTSGEIIPSRNYYISTSQNFVDWTHHLIGSGYFSVGPAIWTGSEFMIVCQHMTTLFKETTIYASGDGYAWNTYQTPYMRSIVWDGRRIVGIAEYFGYKILASADMNNWDIVAEFDNKKPITISWSGSVFVLGVENMTSGEFEILTSADGGTWTTVYSTDRIFRNIKWCHDEFLSVSDNVVLSSPSGIKWQEELLPYID